MKKFSKILSVALLVALVLSLGVANAFADAPTTGDIVISEGTVQGSTYTAYLVFELSMNEGETAYTYTIKSDSQFYSTVAADTTNFTLTQIAVDGSVTTYQVTPKDAFDDAAAADFAKTLSELTLTGGTTSEAATADGATVTISNLPLGYYFVTTTTGTVCSLDTNNSRVAIKDKNEKPSIKKEVQEDRDGKWGKKNDAEIGQVVNFKTTVTAQKGAKNYIVHDTMTDGLTYNNDAAVTGATAGVAASGSTAATGDYHVVKINDHAFDVVFHDTYLDNITGSTTIEITYSATVNENAKINKVDGVYGNGNDNDTVLDYGTDKSTEHDWTRTYVWDVDVFKYAAPNKPLADAKFVISKDKLTTFDDANSVTNKLTFTDITVTGEVPTYRLDPNGTVTEITTDETGKFKLVGFDESNTLAADIYYLYETAAPAGYNKLTAPIEIKVIAADIVATDRDTAQTITNEHTFTPSSTASGSAAVDVLNNSGTELPSTGGIGTTIFYVVGGVLVLAAIILLVTKKRMSE